MTNSMSRVKPEPLKKFYNEEYEIFEFTSQQLAFPNFKPSTLDSLQRRRSP